MLSQLPPKLPPGMFGCLSLAISPQWADMPESGALLGFEQDGSVCVVATSVKGHDEYAVQTGARSTRR